MNHKPDPADFTHNGVLQQTHYDNAVKAWEKIERMEIEDMVCREPFIDQTAIDYAIDYETVDRIFDYSINYEDFYRRLEIEIANR